MLPFIIHKDTISIYFPKTKFNIYRKVNQTVFYDALENILVIYLINYIDIGLRNSSVFNPKHIYLLAINVYHIYACLAMQD